MITIKTEAEIAVLREGGKILADIMHKIIQETKPGATTGDLEYLAVKYMEEAGGRPSFKNYKYGGGGGAFPTALCTSINDEVVHAPSLPSRELSSGDILGLDIGMEYPFSTSSSKLGTKGLYTDMAMTIGVGKINMSAKKLLQTAKKCLQLAISQVKPGRTLYDLAGAIQAHAEKNGFSVVKELVGHGVGYSAHEEPQIPNFVSKEFAFPKVVLRPGMVLAIEPMINVGGWKIIGDENGHTIRTQDGSLSAQFEHTVAVTKNGCIVLTEI